MSKNNSFFGIRNILKILSVNGVKVHFSGVGGVGMYPLFCLAEKFGISVSGSDREAGEFLGALIESGRDIYIGERCKLGSDVGLVVYSLALSDDNRELKYAARNGIPTVSRAEFLGALMKCYQDRIGVSGTHGKSTVCAMLSAIFTEGCRMPTVLCGARLPSGSPFLSGSLDCLIYEACEYKDSFHKFSPTLAVFLNMELDHTDWFESVEALGKSFLAAINKSDLAIINRDDKGLSALLPLVRTKYITVGKDNSCDYRYEITEACGRHISFSLYRRGELISEFDLHLLGRFNASNAAMAAVAAIESGIDLNVIKKALSSFSGIERRLEECGEYKGRKIYYDYAHHPTEIAEGIKAVKEENPEGVTVIFSPHTYSRTKALFEGFVNSLSLADSVLLTEIDAVREKDNYGVNSQMLADAVGGKVCTRVNKIIEETDKTKGAIIVMGAARCEHILKAFLE